LYNYQYAANALIKGIDSRLIKNVPAIHVPTLLARICVIDIERWRTCGFLSLKVPPAWERLVLKDVLHITSRPPTFNRTRLALKYVLNNRNCQIKLSQSQLPAQLLFQHLTRKRMSLKIIAPLTAPSTGRSLAIA